MARVTGPLFSMDASGQLGKALVYAKWKGRNYVREYVVPTNPNSIAQRAGRAMMGFLAAQWALLSPANQATWEGAAAAEGISPFNAYVGANMDRWSLFTGVGQTDPIGGTGTKPSNSLPTPEGGVGEITIPQPWSIVEDGWATIMHISKTSSFTAAKSNVVAIRDVAIGAGSDIVAKDIEPGTWYVQYASSTKDGLYSASGEGEATVVVT